LSELRKLLLHGTIFWRSDSVFPWRDTRISSPTKKL
jgi:hypothetical protein